MTDFVGIIPPFDLVPFEEMKKKQANQYFQWFMETKEERIQKLQEYINLETKKIILDKTPESLILLWKWFQNHIIFESKTEREIKEELHTRPEWMHDHVLEDPVKISTHTFLLSYNISIYIGEVIINNAQDIYWGILCKPRKLYGVNCPRLFGFKGKMTAYLYGKIETCVWKYKHNTSNEEPLYHIYEICMKNIE